MYKIRKITVDFMALTNVSYQQGANSLELPYYHKVPISNGRIPAAAESAYLAFESVQTREFDKMFSSSVVPWAQTDSTSVRSTFVRSPMLSTSVLDAPHYAESFLFIKPSATATSISIRGILHAEIDFFKYDGQGLASLPIATI